VSTALNRSDYPSFDPIREGVGRWLEGVALGGRLAHPALLFQNEAFLSKGRAVSPELYSREWFDQAARIRHERSAPWLTRLLEFHKHPGEQVVCLGPTLGSDWVQYARNGAELSVYLPTDPWVRLVQRHFALQGLDARFQVQGQGTLPLESATVDVVCWNTLNEDSDHLAKTAREIQRVLKPGGKLILLGCSFSNLDGWLGASPFGWSGPVFSRSQVKAMFEGMVEMRFHQRCLKRNEIHWMIRWLPVSLMQRLIGRCLVFKAFKPLPSLRGKPLVSIDEWEERRQDRGLPG